MKTFKLSILILAVIISTASAQEALVGKWETKTRTVTGKPGITVAISKRGDTLGGTVMFVNPDSTTLELPILNASFTGNTFRFKTDDQKGTWFSWWLTVKKGAKGGTLNGSDQRPGKFGSSNGEALIEERVNKRD